MTDLELINKFLERIDLTHVELKLKDKCFALQEAFNLANTSLAEARKTAQVKEVEYVQVKAQLENILGFVLDLEKGR